VEGAKKKLKQLAIHTRVRVWILTTAPYSAISYMELAIHTRVRV